MAATGSRACPPLIILGAGPVGLFAALRARQLGLQVEILTDRLPGIGDPRRLEAVPAQAIALLVEFGVHPALLGVDRTHGRRLTQWRSSNPVATEAPASAHLSRPALELALLDLAHRAGVRIRQAGRLIGTEFAEAIDSRSTILDATGRAAVTVREIVRPAIPIVCRTLTQAAGAGTDLDGFSLAAGAEGYVYRLGNVQQITIGVVGHGALLRGSPSSVVEHIRSFAPWILAGIDPRRLAPSSAGAASLQWSGIASDGIQPIGDARMARDALASQGLAIGIADALHEVAMAATRTRGDSHAPAAQRKQHQYRVASIISESPFASAPPWRHYLAFLRDML